MPRMTQAISRVDLGLKHQHGVAVTYTRDSDSTTQSITGWLSEETQEIRPENSGRVRIRTVFFTFEVSDISGSPNTEDRFTINSEVWNVSDVPAIANGNQTVTLVRREPIERHQEGHRAQSF